MNYAASQYSFDGKSSKVADRRKPASAAPWTASRCNRLLRTITSRIAVLRRLKKLDDQIRTAPTLSGEQSLPGSRHSSPTSEQDISCPDSPEWLPRKGSRCMKRTYAGRKKAPRTAPEQSRMQSSAALFPTPLVKMIMSGPEQCSPFAFASPLNAFASNQAPVSRRSTKLPVRPLSSLEEAQRNLLAAFETFLNSTRPIDLPSRIGAGSLMNVCLGKVAHYIELEEEAVALADGEDSQASEVAFDLYSELETLGSKAGGGWAGLRQVIRMHGIRLVELAIIDGLIPALLVDQLLDICDKLLAFQESHVIMEAHSTRSNIDVHAFWFQRAQPCLAQGGAVYWLRNIAKLLRNGRLSCHSFSKRTLKVLWKIFLRVLVDTDYTVAMDFIGAYTASLNAGRAGDNWQPTTPLLKGLVDVLGILTAIILTSESTRTRQNTIRLLHYKTATHKLGTGSIALDSAMTTITLIMIGTSSKPGPTISFPGSADALERVQDMRQDLARKRATSCATVDFICDIANTVERIGAAPGAAILRRILSSLIKATSVHQTSIRRMLERLAHDCGVRYADETGDRSVVEAVQGGSLFKESEADEDPRGTPASFRARSDYRWEEGLCEWIATTPMARIGIAKDDETVPGLPTEELGKEEEYSLLAQEEHRTIPPPSPPKFGQAEVVAQEASEQTVLRTSKPDGVRQSEGLMPLPGTRKPLSDIGLSTQNRLLPVAILQAGTKKHKSTATRNGASDRRKFNENYIKARWTENEANEQADELSLVTPLRATAAQPPRKRVRWEVSCQDKQPLQEADNISEDELAI